MYIAIYWFNIIVYLFSVWQNKTKNKKQLVALATNWNKLKYIK